jgi:hypothetical protein
MKLDKSTKNQNRKKKKRERDKWKLRKTVTTLLHMNLIWHGASDPFRFNLLRLSVFFHFTACLPLLHPNESLVLDFSDVPKTCNNRCLCAMFHV